MNTNPILVVTGANGFLGSEIVRQAQFSGWKVRATDLHSQFRKGSVDYFQANIMNPCTLVPIVTDANTVIHAAGLAHVRHNKDEAEFQRINALGTSNVIQLACQQSVKRFVLISSVAVYGDVTHNVTESASCMPMDAYAKSKMSAENEALRISQVVADLQLVVLRFTTLYGREDPGNVLRLIRAIKRHRFFRIGNGSTLKTLLHREDAARACLIAAQHPLDDKVSIFNVGSEPISLKKLVDQISMILGNRQPRISVHPQIAFFAARLLAAIPHFPNRIKQFLPMLNKWMSESTYDSSRICDILGFTPQISLEQGLREEIAWWQEVDKRC